MESLVLKGTTLGERHKHYNSLLKDAISNKTQPAKIDYKKSDVENLFNIDIASHNKDVAYILDVLKGDDMLYVSRAIKKSDWLINDDEFDHIIEPQYLHSDLFPQMMPKACCKFLLHIRLNLKNETRIDEFFLYLKEKNLMTALKWLPYCSLEVIEDTVARHVLEISPNLIRRLCLRSSTVLDVFVRSHGGHKTQELQAAMVLLRTNTEQYIEALGNYNRYYKPTFGKKQTEFVMKRYPHHFIDNFDTYWCSIDIDTFARYMKSEDIESFLLTQLKNKDVDSVLDQEKLSLFIKYMPTRRKYQFIQKLIDRSREEQEAKNDSAVGLMFGEVPFYYGRGGGNSDNNNYRWYKYAPFDSTFADFIKMIPKESNPNGRNIMLMILVDNAVSNLNNIHCLLQYYQENHINEPFRLKIKFIDYLLQETDSNQYDDKTWNILDEIFRSMEVYMESENSVQKCIEAIIIHNITRDKLVPSIIEQKLTFDSFELIRRKLKHENQKEKVFKYLFNILLNKLNKHYITNHVELENYAKQLYQCLSLLKYWDKELTDFPALINKIKDCVKIKKNRGWTVSLTHLYDTKKSWKKILFPDSVILSPSQIVVLNALKHNTELLVCNKDEVEALRFNDAVSMKQVLRKLRVYWPQTIASEWASSYRKNLEKPNGQKATVRGLCHLLNQQQMIDFLKKYEPFETKVDWADTDELKLSVQKNIARNMHIARPQVDTDAVLAYAKGDYVQFTQPSLNAILYNIKPSLSRNCVLNLLNGITSLQKHGIYLAFSKLSTDEMKQVFSDVWQSNANLSVRAAIFEHTHERLCKEHDEELIAELWNTIQTYMDSLTAEENKKIFNTFGRLGKVHISVRPALCMKSYRFLKSLPPKADCKNIIRKMKKEMNNIVEQLDSDFVEDIILEFVDQVLLKRTYGYSHTHDIDLFTSYLLSADDVTTQLKRYENVFTHFMEKSLLLRDKTDEHCNYTIENLRNFLGNLNRSIVIFFFHRHKVNPIALYSKILAKLESELSITRHYIFLRQLKFTIAFLNILDTRESDHTEDLYRSIASNLKDVVDKFLEEDIHLFGSSVYTLFGEAVNNMLTELWVSRSMKLHYLETFLANENNTSLYLLVIELMDAHYNEDDQKEGVKRVHAALSSHHSPVVEVCYYNKFGEYSVMLQNDTNILSTKYSQGQKYVNTTKSQESVSLEWT